MKHPTGRLSVILALGILVAPLAADAQLPKKLFRLGYILPGSPGAYTTSLRGLRQGLRDFGYLEGQNLVIAERYAEGQMERLPEIFTELLGLKVDILVAPGTAIARAAQQVTTSIPIVAIMGDPIGTGLAASLAHPDGNVTGISTLSGEGFSGKWGPTGVSAFPLWKNQRIPGLTPSLPVVYYATYSSLPDSRTAQPHILHQPILTEPPSRRRP